MNLYQNENVGYIQPMRNVALPKGALLRIEGGRRGTIISCRAGSCWITQEGDPRDYFLEAGMELAIDRAGLVVAEGITDGSICIAASPRLRKLAGAREKFLGCRS
ncbi:MAG: DUF2917 domain-containing protein [Candidatus Binatia bacterium]